MEDTLIDVIEYPTQIAVRVKQTDGIPWREVSVVDKSQQVNKELIERLLSDVEDGLRLGYSSGWDEGFQEGKEEATKEFDKRLEGVANLEDAIKQKEAMLKAIKADLIEIANKA